MHEAQHALLLHVLDPGQPGELHGPGAAGVRETWPSLSTSRAWLLLWGCKSCSHPRKGSMHSSLPRDAKRVFARVQLGAAGVSTLCWLRCTLPGPPTRAPGEGRGHGPGVLPLLGSQPPSLDRRMPDNNKPLASLAKMCTGHAAGPTPREGQGNAPSADVWACGAICGPMGAAPAR